MKKFTLLLSLCLAALIVPCSVVNATVSLTIADGTATVSSDVDAGEPFDLTSFTSVEQTAYNNCTTVNFTKITSISSLPSSATTVNYNTTSVSVVNDTYTVSATNGQADLTVLRPLLTGKEFVFDSGITSVDYATYSLEFSDNQKTVEIIAKDGCTVSLTQSNNEKDVLFINSHCTTVKFSGNGEFNDLTAFTNNSKVATTVDFSEAKFSDPSVMTFKYWSGTIETAKGSTSLDTYPNDVIQSCSRLTTLTFGNGIASIDRTSSPGTITFTSSSYDIKFARVEFAFSQDGYGQYTKVFDRSVTSIDMGDYVFNFSGDYISTTNSYDGVTIIAKEEKSVSLNEANQGSMLYTIKQNCTSVAFRGEGTFTSLNAFNNDPHNQTTIDFTGANFSEDVRKAGYWKGSVTKVFYNGAEATVDGENVTIKSSGDETTDNELKAMFTADSKWQESNITIERRTNVAETTYTNGVLTFASTISDAQGLTDAASNISGAICEATKIVFPDGSEWVKSDADSKSTLTCTTANYSLYKSWIETYSSTCIKLDRMKLGKYVTVEGTTTTVTLPQTGVIGSNVDSGNDLTDAERAALGNVGNGNTLKLVGPFSNVDVDALSHKCNPSTLDLSEAIIADGKNAEGAVILNDYFRDPAKTNLTKVVLPNDANYTELPGAFCRNNNKLTSIDFRDTYITKIGNEAFQGCTLLNLSDAEWGTKITEIGEGAFQRCGFGETLNIPNSIVILGKNAFRDNVNLKYLYIKSGSLLQRIEEGAFFHDTPSTSDHPGLKEVHVECQHFIWCDVDAFDESHTNGHTDVATAKCRLFYPSVGDADYNPNYPEEKTDNTTNSFDDYVGNFKSVLFDGVMDQNDFQTLETVVLNGTTKDYVTYGPYPGHGWYMFSSTGIGITQDTKWRTYSEALPYLVPDAAIAKFYLVCGASTNTVKLVQMTPNDIVRKNTGILVNYVYASDMGSGDFQRVIPLTYPSTVEENDNTPYYYIGGGQYTKNGNKYDNYLCKINGGSVPIYNVYPSADAPQYRDFFFGNVDQLRKADHKWWGEDFENDIYNEGNIGSSLRGWIFLRAQTDIYENINNKAFLHLPVKDVNVETDPTSGWSQDVDGNPNLADASGARLLGITIIDDENEQTAVKDVNKQPGRLSDDSYYTLQGQKVSSFAKGGFYIHNGKKVIVK